MSKEMYQVTKLVKTKAELSFAVAPFKKYSKNYEIRTVGRSFALYAEL